MVTLQLSTIPLGSFEGKPLKILLFILLFLCNFPLSAQFTEQTEDTLWIEPILASLKIVLNNAEQVDFVLLESKYANEIPSLPDGVSLASSLSKIDSCITKERKIYYYSFIYHYDGTSRSRGPSTIQNINHSHQSKNK